MCCRGSLRFAPL